VIQRDQQKNTTIGIQFTPLTNTITSDMVGENHHFWSQNMEANAIEIVREYWKRMQSNDFAYAAELFADGYVLDWPQSNERIRGREKFTAVNEEYPAEGRWEFTINRIVGDEETVVTEVSITDGVTQARAITFTTVENGQIVRQVEYWPSEYDPPENRKHLVELIK
jgi:limonene-1,2-epoxide hydrolase